jgi:hypothetical protein
VRGQVKLLVTELEQMEQRFALNGSTIERDGSEKPENDKQECRVICRDVGEWSVANESAGAEARRKDGWEG